MSNAFGIDVSSNQGWIQWDVVAAHDPPVVFCGIRAGISWGYQDKLFAYNWQGAKEQKILRMAYHVIYPDQPIDRQMDNLFRILGDDPGELPPVLDMELDRGQDRGKITGAVLGSDKIVAQRLNRHALLYSRAEWANRFMYPEELAHLDWWLAQYLKGIFPVKEHPGPPDLPRGVTKWLGHQTGDHTPSFGCESQMLDYDRWNGDAAAVYAYAHLPPSPTSWAQAVTDALRSLHFDIPDPVSN